MKIKEKFEIKKDNRLNHSSMLGPEKYYGFCEFISGMYSEDNIEICLEDIETIKQGVKEEICLDGSAFAVTITKDVVTSENLLTSEIYPDTLSFDEFEELFLMWVDHCNNEY